MTTEFFHNYSRILARKAADFFPIIIWFDNLIEKITISLLLGRVQTVAIVLEPRWSEQNSAEVLSYIAFLADGLDFKAHNNGLKQFFEEHDFLTQLYFHDIFLQVSNCYGTA